MVKERHVKLPKEVRQMPEESLREGLGRIVACRVNQVSTTGVKEWSRLLREGIETLSEGLCDADLTVHDCDPMKPVLMEYEPRQSRILLVLESRGEKIANMDVVVRKEDLGVEAAI